MSRVSSRDRLVMFAKTSGTTGAAKLIPVTASSSQIYKTGFRLWTAACYKDHPGMYNGTILPVTAPMRDGQTAGGVPVGSISGLIARNGRMLARKLYAVPQEVATIKNADARYYTLMRLAVESKVSLLSTANPSMLLLIARTADQAKEAIVRDVHDGTLAVSAELGPEALAAIRTRLRPNPARARELEACARRSGRLLPKDYWPGLAVLTCWKGGPLKLYLDGLPEYFGNVPVRDLGLLASEGRMSVPMSDKGAGGILNVTGGFYEFVPAEQERLPGDGYTLLAHELEEGRDYRLIVTSCNGLYRYEIADIVRVEGFEGTAPIISFLNKGAHIASITGEKVSEFQIVTALQRSFRGGVPSAFVVCPAWDAVPYYTLVMEESDAHKIENIAALLEMMDSHLSTLNIEYASKRDSGRLGPIRMTVVADGSLAMFHSAQAHTGQYKAIYLRTEIDYHKRFPKIVEIYAACAEHEREEIFAGKGTAQ